MHKSPYDPVKDVASFQPAESEMIDGSELLGALTTGNNPQYHPDMPAYERMLREKPAGYFVSSVHRSDVVYLLNLVTHLRGY